MLRTCAIMCLALIAGCARNPPLMLRATGTGEECTVSVNGEVFADEKLSGPLLNQLAKEHDKRLIIDSDGHTPYRCIGRTIFNLQGAGFRVVAVRVGGVGVPSR